MGNGLWYGSTFPITVDGHSYTVSFEDHENFQTGGVRRAFKGYFKGRGPRNGEKLVVKAFIDQEHYTERQAANLMIADHSAYAKARKIVNSFSTALNATGTTTLSFKFAESWVTMVSVTSFVYDIQFWTTPSFRKLQPVFVEPYLGGNFTKFTSNNGTYDPDRLTPIALSHYSWVCTRGECLLCDLQGVRGYDGYHFSDPAIHSKSRQYGVTDFGVIGMASFFKRHVCNNFCTKLGIDQIKPDLSAQALTLVCDKMLMPVTMNTVFWKNKVFNDKEYQALLTIYENILVAVNFP